MSQVNIAAFRIRTAPELSFSSKNALYHIRRAAWPPNLMEMTEANLISEKSEAVWSFLAHPFLNLKKYRL